MQFRCSMILFLVLIGIAKTPRHLRLSIVLLIFAYCMGFGRWDVALYMSGVFLAEQYLEKLSAGRALPQRHWKGVFLDQKPPKIHKYVLTSMWLGVFCAGAYLGSFPRKDLGFGSPGFEWIYAISPDYHIWHAYGGLLLVWSLGGLPRLQRLFTGRLMLFLGRISFALYIVHDPVLRIFGFPMVNALLVGIGSQTWLHYQGAVAVGFLLTSVVVLWSADLFQRGVDEPCARLAQWVQKQCFVEEE